MQEKAPMKVKGLEIPRRDAAGETIRSPKPATDEAEWVLAASFDNASTGSAKLWFEV
jgi:hypothetical protein